jgi:hypothetical protein
MQFGGKQSHSGAVLPIMPAECTILPSWCGSRIKHHRRNAGKNIVVA